MTRTARFTLDPAFTVGDVNPPPLRLVRRAHGPLRLHRHLRARPPDRRRGRLPPATCWTWSASWASPPSATPAATSSPATAGRTASARATSARAGCDLAWHTHRDQRSSAWTSSSTGPRKAGVEPMMAVNLGTRGVAGGPRPAGVLQPPGRHRSCPTCARANGAKEPLRHPACGAWATRWTAPGRPATRPPTSTAGWPPRRPGRCACRPRPRAGRLRQLQLARCRPSAPGRPTVLEQATTRWTTSPLHAYYEELDGDLRQLPRLRRQHGPLHRAAWSPPPTTWRPAEEQRSGSTSPSTSGTSGTSRRLQQPQSRRTTGRSRRA